MTEEYIYKKLNEILQEIQDDDRYEESYYAITDCIDEEGRVYSDAFYIACELHSSDETEVMPKCIADFVIEVYLEEIENENPHAMTNLGSLYYTGRCGTQDYAQAVKYYTMADEHGERQATENLGYCYYYGRSVEVDYKKAYHYFVKGALDNHINSLYKVGDMYKNGYYVKKDEKEAFYIYSHCYEQMTDVCAEMIGADICLRMGDVYYYGIGTEKDYEKALKFYQEAERYFYIKIKKGDYFSKKGLSGVIEKQSEIRKKLFAEMPDFEWTKSDKQIIKGR